MTAGQQARKTYQLDVGVVTETVKVEGTAPLLNTVSQSSSNPLTAILQRNFRWLGAISQDYSSSALVSAPAPDSFV